MTPERRSRTRLPPPRRFVCGACDTDLTRLADPAPLPKSFGLCCEAMVLAPGETSRAAH